MTAAAIVDESTPLLHRSIKQTPFPWFQFSIILFLELSEPLTAQVIYPFAPQLVRDIGITHGHESQVGYYVGLIQALFFLTEAMTVLHWSRLSDRIGRKPVILCGLFGLSISMYCFGLSKTFWGLVISRCLNGALTGNIIVVKNAVAEMTDSTNIAKAYAYMPISWSLGGTLGPMIGGSLANPAQRFPTLFGSNKFWKTYPYFLPCAVPATFTAVAWLVTLFFLKETAPNAQPISEYLGFSKAKLQLQMAENADINTSSSDTTIAYGDTAGLQETVSFRSLLTYNVVIAATNYATLALVEIAFHAIQPVFFATPIHLGGLSLSPPAIGRILSISGLLNGVFQVFFFAQLHDRYGTKAVFIGGLVAAIPSFALFPLANSLAKQQGYSTAVWLVIALQTIASNVIFFSYGAIFVFTAAACPDPASLGATNGLGQVMVSLMRAVGPALANSLFSYSIEVDYLGGNLVYYVLLILTGICIYVGWLLPRQL